jgi:hypothetical protein
MYVYETVKGIVWAQPSRPEAAGSFSSSLEAWSSSIDGVGSPETQVRNNWKIYTSFIICGPTWIGSFLFFEMQWGIGARLGLGSSVGFWSDDQIRRSVLQKISYLTPFFSSAIGGLVDAMNQRWTKGGKGIRLQRNDWKMQHKWKVIYCVGQ